MKGKPHESRECSCLPCCAWMMSNDVVFSRLAVGVAYSQEGYDEVIELLRGQLISRIKEVGKTYRGAEPEVKVSVEGGCLNVDVRWWPVTYEFLTTFGMTKP